MLLCRQVVVVVCGKAFEIDLPMSATIDDLRYRLSRVLAASAFPEMRQVDVGTLSFYQGMNRYCSRALPEGSFKFVALSREQEQSGFAAITRRIEELDQRRNALEIQLAALTSQLSSIDLLTKQEEKKLKKLGF